MVRIQTKTIRKKRKGCKQPHNYSQHLIPVPMRRNPEINSFLKKDLDFEMAVQGDILIVKLLRKSNEGKEKT